jgi:hypothetical protein
MTGMSDSNVQNVLKWRFLDVLNAKDYQTNIYVRVVVLKGLE